jgi:DNA-binding response OmpR family regulator
MPKAHVFLADDEKAITDYLKPIMERSGFEVTVAYDGDSALSQINRVQPDVVVLDVIMPGMDGREVCRRLRAAENWTPVIMLTQVSTTTDKVLSLEEGADDYICKPFDPQELIARIHVILRRREISPKRKPLSMSSRLRSGGILLDRLTRRVEKDGCILDLTPKALALLEHLMLHPDRVLTREQLMDAVWGWAQAVATRAVDMRIAELRRIIGDDADLPTYIETVVGVGYRFLAPVEALD